MSIQNSILECLSPDEKAEIITNISFALPQATKNRMDMVLARFAVIKGKRVSRSKLVRDAIDAYLETAEKLLESREEDGNE